MDRFRIEKLKLIFVDSIKFDDKEYKFPCCMKLLLYIINAFFAMGGFILIGMGFHALCKSCDSIWWIPFLILLFNILFVALTPLKELK